MSADMWLYLSSSSVVRWCLVTSPLVLVHVVFFLGVPSWFTSPLVSVNDEFFPCRPLTYGCIPSIHSLMFGYLSVGLGKRRVFPSCPLTSSCDFFSHSSSLWCLDVAVPFENKTKKYIYPAINIKSQWTFPLVDPCIVQILRFLVFNPCLPWKSDSRCSHPFGFPADWIGAAVAPQICTYHCTYHLILGHSISWYIA